MHPSGEVCTVFEYGKTILDSIISILDHRLKIKDKGIFVQYWHNVCTIFGRYFDTIRALFWNLVGIFFTIFGQYLGTFFLQYLGNSIWIITQ